MAYTDIDDPSVHFNTVPYSGSASTPLVITGVGFQPDLTWLKSRSTAWFHGLFSSSSGIGAGSGYKYLSSSSDAAEADTWGTVTFGSDGFSGVSSGWNGSFAHDFGQGGQSFVSWNWKCNGGTKADNNDGSITVNLQVNQEAGFSIGTYTGTGSQLTLGHGLGVAPKMHITKKLNSADAWNVYHESLGNTHGLRLNGTDAKEDFGFYGDTSPTSSVFTVGGVASNDRLNTNGGSYLFYSFAEKQGYSKFGSYVGNGSTNGSYIYLGFKPAWVLYKKSSAPENWHIVDNKRDTLNPNSFAIDANTQGAEANDANLQMDFLSNGFKLRTLHGTANGSGETYIYAAFAEHPFVSSEGVPTTAR